MPTISFEVPSSVERVRTMRICNSIHLHSRDAYPCIPSWTSSFAASNNKVPVSKSPCLVQNSEFCVRCPGTCDLARRYPSRPVKLHEPSPTGFRFPNLPCKCSGVRAAMNGAGRDPLDERPGESRQWRTMEELSPHHWIRREARSRSIRCGVHDWLYVSEPGFQGDRRGMKPSYRGPSFDDFFTTIQSYSDNLKTIREMHSWIPVKARIQSNHLQAIVVSAHSFDGSIRMTYVESTSKGIWYEIRHAWDHPQSAIRQWRSEAARSTMER